MTFMTITPTAAHAPTTLERITALAGLCATAKGQLAPTDPQVAWEALVDAQAALEAAVQTLVALALGLPIAQAAMAADRDEKRSNGGEA